MLKWSLVLVFCIAFYAGRSVGLVSENAEAETNPEYWRLKAQETLRANLRKMTLNNNPAKNVILFIGDGMDIATMTSGRILRGQRNGFAGEESSTAIDKFPHLALSKVYTVDSQTPDSAGTATALLTGIKTKSKLIGLNGKVVVKECGTAQGNEVETILEQFARMGRSTGIVTTTHVTHATPCAAYAHSPSRSWITDANLPPEAKQLGCKDIGSQLIEKGRKINVILGGGRAYLRPRGFPDEEYGKSETSSVGRNDSRNLIDEWLKMSPTQNAKYVWNKRGFEAAKPRNTDYLLGLFEPKHMKFEHERREDKGGEPSLAQMTAKAIKILRKNGKGFFLLVEGGKIDHGHHTNRANVALEEFIAFDKAVASAVAMTKENETLIVVTADHGHMFTHGGYSVRGNPVNGLAEDHRNPTSTKDGSWFTSIAYGNGPGSGKRQRKKLTKTSSAQIDFKFPTAIPLSSETHSSSDVAVLARGPMAHLIGGVIEQNYIGHVMKYASCVGDDKSHCYADENMKNYKCPQDLESRREKISVILKKSATVINATLSKLDSDTNIDIPWWCHEPDLNKFTPPIPTAPSTRLEKTTLMQKATTFKPSQNPKKKIEMDGKKVTVAKPSKSNKPALKEIPVSTASPVKMDKTTVVLMTTTTIKATRRPNKKTQKNGIIIKPSKASKRNRNLTTQSSKRKKKNTQSQTRPSPKNTETTTELLRTTDHAIRTGGTENQEDSRTIALEVNPTKFASEKNKKVTSVPEKNKPTTKASKKIRTTTSAPKTMKATTPASQKIKPTTTASKTRNPTKSKFKKIKAVTPTHKTTKKTTLVPNRIKSTTASSYDGRITRSSQTRPTRVNKRTTSKTVRGNSQPKKTTKKPKTKRPRRKPTPRPQKPQQQRIKATKLPVAGSRKQVKKSLKNRQATTHRISKREITTETNAPTENTELTEKTTKMVTEQYTVSTDDLKRQSESTKATITTISSNFRRATKHPRKSFLDAIADTIKNELRDIRVSSTDFQPVKLDFSIRVAPVFNGDENLGGDNATPTNATDNTMVVCMLWSSDAGLVGLSENSSKIAFLYSPPDPEPDFEKQQSQTSIAGNNNNGTVVVLLSLLTVSFFVLSLVLVYLLWKRNKMLKEEIEDRERERKGAVLSRIRLEEITERDLVYGGSPSNRNNNATTNQGAQGAKTISGSHFKSNFFRKSRKISEATS